MGVLNIIHQDKKFVNIAYYIFIIFIIGFAGSRFEVGLDWNRYIDIFESSIGGSFFALEKAEPLFSLMARICNDMHLSFTLFILFVATISIGTKAYVFNKLSSIPFVVFLFYFPFFINGEMGQIRQFLSLSFILISSLYIIRQQVYPFLLLVLTASLLHFSAFLFIPVYFLVKYVKSIWIYFGAILFAILLNELNIFGFISESIEAFPVYFQQKISYYYDRENGPGIFSQTLLFRFLLLGTILFFQLRNDIPKDAKTDVFLKIYFWGIVFFLLFGSFPTLTDRGIVFYKIFDVFLIANLIASLTKKYGYKHWVPIFIFASANMYYFRHVYYIYLKYGDVFIPYKSWFFNG